MHRTACTGCGVQIAHDTAGEAKRRNFKTPHGRSLLSIQSQDSGTDGGVVHGEMRIHNNLTGLRAAKTPRRRRRLLTTRHYCISRSDQLEQSMRQIQGKQAIARRLIVQAHKNTH